MGGMFVLTSPLFFHTEETEEGAEGAEGREGLKIRRLDKNKIYLYKSLQTSKHQKSLPPTNNLLCVLCGNLCVLCVK